MKKLIISLALLSSFLIGNNVSAAPMAFIVNEGSNDVSVVDTATYTVVATIPVGAGPEMIAMHPLSATAYVTCQASNTVSVIDTVFFTETAVIGGFSYPRAVAVSPNGAWLYVADGGTDTLSVVDTSSYSVVATVSVGGNPRGIDVSPDGLMVFVTNVMSDTVSVIDTTALTAPAVTINVGSYPLGIAVAPDGDKVYIANNGTNDVSVIDTASRMVTSIIPVGEWPYGIAVSPDGSTVYVANNGTNDISVIDTASETVTATIPVGSGSSGVAVTPGGTKVVVANAQQNNVSIIDTLSLTVTTTVPVGLNPNFMGKFIAGPRKSLLIEKGGSGAGDVKSLKLKSIDCGATCESNFQGGIQVKLKAKSDKSSVFKEWSGACSGIKKECYVTIEGGVSKIAVAMFLRYPTIRVKPVAKDFKGVKTGSTKKARFTVKNKTTKGKQSLNIGQISILSRVFAIIAESDGCSNTSLGPGGSCRFEVQFSPIMQGLQNSTIEIPSNDPDSPLTIISVSGEGI